MKRERSCIKCDREMIPWKVEEVEVDYCPGCHGLWLDQDEIQALGAKGEAALTELRELVQQGAEGMSEQPAASGRPCPACAARLSLARLGSFSLEHCMVCGGIFLDRGELDQVLGQSAEQENRIATVVALARSVASSGSIGT